MDAQPWHQTFKKNFRIDLRGNLLNLLPIRILLLAAAFVLVVASTVGFTMGVISGFQGGILDKILMRITDLFMEFPSMILAIAITATLGASLQNTLIALSVVFWPWYARVVRAQKLALREQEFVTASQSLGASKTHIILRHLLPNLMPILITQLTLDVGYVILSTAGLSFLGLGAQPPTPEWGAMIMSACQFMRESWWYTNLIQNQRNRQKIVDTFHRYKLPTRSRQPSC